MAKRKPPSWVCGRISRRPKTVVTYARPPASATSVGDCCSPPSGGSAVRVRSKLQLSGFDLVPQACGLVNPGVLQVSVCAPLSTGGGGGAVQGGRLPSGHASAAGGSMKACAKKKDLKHQTLSFLGPSCAEARIPAKKLAPTSWFSPARSPDRSFCETFFTVSTAPPSNAAVAVNSCRLYSRVTSTQPANPVLVMPGSGWYLSAAPPSDG